MRGWVPLLAGNGRAGATSGHCCVLSVLTRAAEARNVLSHLEEVKMPGRASWSSSPSRELEACHCRTSSGTSSLVPSSWSGRAASTEAAGTMRNGRLWMEGRTTSHAPGWACGAAGHQRTTAFGSCWRMSRWRNRSRIVDAAGRRAIPATAHSTSEGPVQASGESARVRES